jgi:hypothetical protein
MTALRTTNAGNAQQFASGTKATDTKALAAGLADTQNQRIDTSEQAGLQDTQQSSAAAQALGPAAVQRGAQQIAQAQALRTSALQDVETKKADTMAQFKNDTALSVQNQRFAVQGQLAQQISDTLDQMGQQGFAADSPQAQAAVTQLKAGAIQQVGNLSAQTAVAYHAQRTNLMTAYDNLATQARTAQDTMVGQATSEANKYIGLSEQSGANLLMQGSQLTQAYRSAAIQAHAANDQQLASLNTSADQFQLAGQQGLSDLINNWQATVAPLAGIVAGAAKLTADQYTANAQSIGAVDYAAGGANISGSFGTAYAARGAGMGSMGLTTRAQTSASSNPTQSSSAGQASSSSPGEYGTNPQSTA